MERYCHDLYVILLRMSLKSFWIFHNLHYLQVDPFGDNSYSCALLVLGLNNNRYCNHWKYRTSEVVVGDNNNRYSEQVVYKTDDGVAVLVTCMFVIAVLVAKGGTELTKEAFWP